MKGEIIEHTRLFAELKTCADKIIRLDSKIQEIHSKINASKKNSY